MFSAKFFAKVARLQSYCHDFSRDYGSQYRQTGKMLSNDIYSKKLHIQRRAKIWQRKLARPNVLLTFIRLLVKIRSIYKLKVLCRSHVFRTIIVVALREY